MATAALILLALTTSGACPPDPDLSGLVAAMRVTADRLAGLDAQAVLDGAEALEARARERAGLCEELEGKARRIRVLQADVDSYRDLLDIATARADMLKGELSLRAPAATRSRWWGCFVGGTVTAPFGGEPVAYGVGGGCGVSLW